MSNVTDTLAQTLADIAGSIEQDVDGVKYSPGREGFDRLPAVIVGLPTLDMTEPDEAEDHIGGTDRRYDFPVDVVVDLDDVYEAHLLAVQLAECFTAALAESQTSFDDPGFDVLEAKVTRWDEPVIVEDAARPQYRYPLTVLVFGFIPD